jgi:hypothetical protein
MRELKARAALEGIKLKDYFAALVQAALQRPVGASAAPVRSPAPVFHRKSAQPLPAMPALTNAQLAALMDGEDVKR